MGRPKKIFFKIFFFIFSKSVGDVSNNVAGVSGRSKRIKNFFMIFEKKKFENFFGPQKIRSGGGRMGDGFGVASLRATLHPNCMKICPFVSYF